MRELREFKNIHPGSDIYIVASGASLNFIDMSFFDNRITIGINEIYKILNTTYLIRKEELGLDVFLKQKSIKFISKGDCGSTLPHLIEKTSKTLQEYLNNFGDDNTICVYDHEYNECRVDEIPEDDNKLIVSYSTICTGIHLAAYMGAKNIIIVGHDCGTIDGKTNVDGYYNEDDLKEDPMQYNYKNFLSNFTSQTIKLKGLLKIKYGCNVHSLNPFVNFHLDGHIFEKC